MEKATTEEMSLNDLIKEEARKKTRKIAYFSLVSVVLVATASFGLGRLTKITGEREPVRIELPTEEESRAVLGASVQDSTVAPASAQGSSATKQWAPTSAKASAGKYVASKTGSKYHLPWCSGAQRIKEENKVWFNTKAEAEAAGYTPAANCPGI